MLTYSSIKHQSRTGKPTNRFIPSDQAEQTETMTDSIRLQDKRFLHN